MNFNNRTLFIADNLDIMRGMDSDTVNLIYLDPPFNTKKQYKAPIGSPAEGASFKDIWTNEDVKDGWYSKIAEQYPHIHQIILAAEHTYDHSMMIYLMAMTIRLIEMRRILKSTGSIYLHCDPTASHYLKTVMDDLFGRRNFRNEIVWQRTNTHGLGNQFGRVHDTILFYSKSNKKVWNDVYTEHDPEYVERIYRHSDERGIFQVDNLTGGSFTQKGESGQPWRGINPSLVGRNWSAPRRSACPEDIKLPDNYESLSVHQKLDVLDDVGLIYWPPKGRVPRFKRYLSTSEGRKIHDVITDISPVASKSKERTGWPTQKPLKLLERIIKASSNENDVVLDPFCGCATACVAAEKLQRQWIGIDISPDAEIITKMRLDDASEQGELFSSIQMSDVTVISDEEDYPVRTDVDDPNLQQLSLPPYRVHKNYLYGIQAGNCNGCRRHFEIQNLSVDHIVPQSKDGTDHPKNLQLLCNFCNSTKGNRTQEYLIEKLKEQGVLR